MSDILFADDDPAMREVVADTLRADGHQVRLARNGTEALDLAHQSPPELVLLDYRMGNPDGLEVCRRIKADARLSHLPVLILTAQGQLEDRLQGFTAGADDYLAKPFDPRELLARVGALLRLARWSLDRNPTTGLPGGFAIDAEIERRRRLGEPFAVCYFDLDYFKPFADRFGFGVADAVIRDFGDVVTSAARGDGAFAGHIGGDDFVLLCNIDSARRLTEETRREFDRRLPRHLPEEVAREGSYRAEDRAGVLRDFPLTRISAAIVRVEPGMWTSLAELGEVVADTKRRAKQSGESGIAEAEMVP